MKNVPESFKIDIRTYGRQFNVKLKVNNSDFNADNLNYIKPSFTTSLFKTIMHQIELDSKVYMPKDTKISGRIGIKVNEKTYKYIDVNTYYVHTCERQEDTNSYRIMAYTKMKEAMIDYDLELVEKLTVRDYLIKICERLNWNTDNIPSNFINSEKLIDPNLHTGIKYTFRDALDELATITCSFLFFNGNNFYLKYLTETNETIDESYLDEDNITIGEKYFINSLVFSRAEESDNIYRKDDESILENGLHEYRIADCQLLSTNDRADYIDEMFNYLKTLEFYIFDIQSKGILFLEACDLFNLKLNNVTYKVALLNDETSIDDGLTENLYLDKPEKTETEYKYADDTDKKMNQINFIIDKQNKKMQGIISDIGDRSEKATTITADIDGLNSKVSELTVLTNTVTGNRIELENCSFSEIGELIITGDIEVLTLADDVIGNYGTVPMEDLAPLGTLVPSKPQKQSKATYVSDSTYLLDTTLIHIKPDNTKVKIKLPDFTLRTLGEVKDEFHIKDGKAYIIQKIELDDAGYKYVLDEPKTIELGSIKLILEEGTNTLYMEGFPSAILTATYMIKNDLANNFATKVELSTSIKQTSSQIMTEVNKKVDEDEFGTKIIQDYKSVQIAWNKIDELIQFINGKIKILNQSKQTLMTLDKTGQHFFSNDEEFGDMGVHMIGDKRYISFSVNGEYGESTIDGMAWGVTTQSDNSFKPILFIKNFDVAPKNSDSYYGQLVLSMCDLVLEGMNTGIISGNIKITGNDITNSLSFEDIDSEEILFQIVPENSTLETNAEINILNNAIKFSRNQMGSNTFKIGNSKTNYCLFTDEGDLHAVGGNIFLGDPDSTTFIDLYPYRQVNIWDADLYVDGYTYAKNISSDERLKKNIKNSETNATEKLSKIEIKSFDFKKDNSHIKTGFIAQQMEKIDTDYVLKKPEYDKNNEIKDYKYYINELPILATLVKGFQEQQETIEQLQNKIKEMEEKIND